MNRLGIRCWNGFARVGVDIASFKWKPRVDRASQLFVSRPSPFVLRVRDECEL